MRWPLFISMSLHESIVNPLLSRLSGLEEERKLLLDRLLTIGGIGTLYTSPVQSDSSPNTESAEEPIDAEAAIVRSLSRKPSQLAAYYTKKAFMDANRRFDRPSVARIPDMSKINEALDIAEAAGK
jgi:hypothetical protein